MSWFSCEILVNDDGVWVSDERFLVIEAESSQDARQKMNGIQTFWIDTCLASCMHGPFENYSQAKNPVSTKLLLDRIQTLLSY